MTASLVRAREARDRDGLLKQGKGGHRAILAALHARVVSSLRGPRALDHPRRDCKR